MTTEVRGAEIGTAQRKLYAIAIEEYRKGLWIPGKVVYTHAYTQVHAYLAYKDSIRTMPWIRILAVAEAIGYFVEDKKGEVLSLD